ncbi:GLUG motif-containing protein [Bradyrhizobium sp. DN5]|uniref:GLUG motif-containing protein n=1 Tax=Bradyrhizobium sp. DN5 TaxID=3056950 RepID=UPI0035253373
MIAAVESTSSSVWNATLSAANFATLYNRATFSTTTPAGPSGLGGTAASNSQINLSWTNNATNEDGFNIERSVNVGANIDATGITIAPFGSSSNPFTGTFDGNGHTINIVGNGIYVGLFAELGAGGKISNLGLTNLSVSAARGYDVGGLVGRNLGKIESSYTTGSISGTAGNFVAGLNGIAIGGVAGWNFGTIKNSYSTATITSDSTIFVDLGGLAGGNSGTIDHSHANGLVLGHSGAYGTGLVEIGGLVGSLGDVNGRSGLF